jgi:hypothetical protein
MASAHERTKIQAGRNMLVLFNFFFCLKCEQPCRSDVVRYAIYVHFCALYRYKLNTQKLQSTQNE